MTMLLRTPTHRAPLPVLRAAVFTVVGTVLGAGAHHLVADDPAPLRQIAAAAVVLFGVGLVGTRRPRSLATVVATCGAAQAGLHQWLTATGSAHHTAALGVAGHDRQGMSAPNSFAMTAGHAAAALFVAVLLHRADAACWFLTRGLVEAVDSVRARIGTVRALSGDRPATWEPGPPAPVRAWLERPPPEGAVLADVVVRRGPPRAGFTLFHRPRRSGCHAARTSPVLETPMPRTTRHNGIRRMTLTAAAAATAVLFTAGPAAAHVEVESDDAQALAQNVELGFTAESESATAGISELRVILPKGIAPTDVTYGEGPEHWKFTAEKDGFTVKGTAVKVGEDAEFSVVVRQLPDAKELVFKTLQTYSDGKIDRWIELGESGGDGHGHGNTAPVLKLKAAAPGAEPVSPSPSESESESASPRPSAEKSEPSSSPAARASEDDGSGLSAGAWTGIGAGVLVVAGGVVYLVRRQGGAQE